MSREGGIIVGKKVQQKKRFDIPLTLNADYPITFDLIKRKQEAEYRSVVTS